MTSQIHIKAVYSIPDFCAAFSIGRTKAYAEMKEGRLRSFKVGGCTRIAGEDGLAWRERYRAGVTEMPSACAVSKPRKVPDMPSENEKVRQVGPHQTPAGAPRRRAARRG